MKKNIIVMLLTGIFFFTIPSFSHALETGAENIGVLSPTGSLGSIEDVVGGTNYVYASQDGVNDAGFLIISMADPQNPSVVSKVPRESSHSIKSCDVNADETIAVVGAGSNLYVIDISDKNNPNKTKTIHIGSTVYDVEIVGDIVYCAGFSSGLPMINISNVNDPYLIYDGKYDGYDSDWLQGIYYDDANKVVLAAGGDYFHIFPLNSTGYPETPIKLYLTTNTMWSVEKISQTKIAISESYGNIFFVDISDINSPQNLGSVDVGGIAYELYYSNELGTKILISDYDDGLNVVDFTSFSSPNHVGVMTTTTGGARGYSLGRFGDYMLLAGGVFGLLVYNLSDCLSFEGSIPSYNLWVILTLICLTTIIYGYKKRILKN